MARVAIIDRNDHSRDELVRSLGGEHDVTGIPDIARALREVVPTAWEVVVFDAAALADVGADGALLASLQGLEGRPELIIISDQANLALVSQAQRAGAYELLAKPVDLAALKQAVANAAQLHGFRNERRRIDAQNRQQRVELEALVEQRTHQMQQIFANVPAMLFRVVSDRGVRREFTFVSENCEALLEFSAADLLSDAARFEALVHPNDRARFLLAREAAEAAGTSLRFEGRFVLPSGRERWLQCVAQPTRLAQGAVAWDGLLVDVSERMELQSQLLLADRLAVIGTISAALSHEVNNPLFCVSTSLVAIAEQLSALEGPVQVHQLIDEALAGIQRIEHTLADLRSFSRVADNGPSSVRVTQVLDASVRLASNEIRHRAQLVRDYRSDPFVVADESSLAQVFLNVLISAAQSIPEGDASSNLLCVAVWNQGDIVQIEVSDSSKGTAKDRLNCALDPDSDTVERLRSGVGLYVSQQLVARMGGEMSAVSTQRGGNCFRVSLPIVPYAAARPTRPPLKLVRSRSLRILVIDDEELVARALSRNLVGHAVTAVTSGREAIDLIRSEAPFDLVLCDVMMPDLTGADVYDAVRAQQAGAEKRIVFVTGGAFTRNAHDFLQSVPNRRIEKPFSRASLDALINEVTP